VVAFRCDLAILTSSSASRQLQILLKQLRSLHRFTHKHNWTVLNYAKKEELAAYHAAACSIMNAIRRLRADVDEQIVKHEAAPCNQILQKVKPLPQELRDMIYGFIFQDSAARLLAEEDEKFECYVDACLESGNTRRIPYRYLLEPDYFVDDAVIRENLARGWFETTKFGIMDPSIMNSFLLQFPWSTGLQPLSLLHHVTLVIFLESDTVDHTGYLERFKSLLLLDKAHTKITICVNDLIYYPNFRDAKVLPLRAYAQSAAYLFPDLVELRRKGYKVTVRSERGLEFLVEPEETTVEGWTKKFEAAVEEARIKFWKEEYSGHYPDWDDMQDKMEDASQKYISDSSQHYFSGDLQDDDSDESREDESDGSQEDDMDESEG